MEAATWASEPEHDITIETNWLFELRCERFRSLQTQKVHDYYVLRMADAVAVVAVTADDEVILVRQFRAGSRLDHWEIPGGLVHPGEDPLEAGPRELFEETGFRGEPGTILGTVWTNPALVTTRMTTILIPNACRTGDPTPDSHEELVVRTFPRGEVAAMVRAGRITHGLANLALLTWLHWDDRLAST